MALVIKNLPANAGDIRDVGSIPGSGRSPGGGHCKPLQYSCLENPHGQRSLAGYSLGATKSRARLGTHGTQGGAPGAGATEAKGNCGSCPDSEKNTEKSPKCEL